MTTHRTLRLAECTTAEARAALADPPAVGLLPIGAIEAHGPHLPLDTDVCLSLEWCERIATELTRGATPPASALPIILPPLMLAVTNYAAGFPGSLSLRPETERAVLDDFLDSLGRAGLRRVALINSHLEPGHVAILEQVAAQRTAAPRPLFVNHCRKPWALELGDEFRSGDCHAGNYETSLMLASRFADRVRTDLARRLPAAYHGLVGKMKSGIATFEAMGAAEAYFGDPAAATRDEGERLWSVLVRMWVERLRESLTDAGGWP